MTAVIEGVTVTGTPQEIAQLINELHPLKISVGTGTLTPRRTNQYYVGDDPSKYITLC